MLYKFYKSIINIIEEKEKRKFPFVIVISIMASILETLTISSIFPFMSLVTNPDRVHDKYYKYIYDLFNFNSPAGFIVSCGFLIIFLFIFKTIFNTFANYVSFSFGQNITKNIKYRLLNNYLKQKYIYYLSTNRSRSSELYSSINSIAGAISGLSIIITEFSIVIIMYSILMIFNWKVMTCITIFLFCNVLLVQRIIQPKFKKVSGETWSAVSNANQYLNSLVHNYKLLKLFVKNDDYVNKYMQLSNQYHDNDCKRMVLERQPKNLLELSGFLIMIGMVIYQELVHGVGAGSSFIPIISLLMLTFYRLLPSITRIMDAKNGIIHAEPILIRVKNELSKVEELYDNATACITLNKYIELKNIEFSYNNKKQILSGVSLKINKGEHIAFIGSSGSGKSTLVDIIMGLYDHSQDLYHLSGDIIIDGNQLADSDLICWRQHIGYIPQEIYLFDGTVAENIVMNHEFDQEKVIIALKKAAIWEFLQQKEGINTHVGDGGVMLSGGQKQRIGIARALYNDPDIIVMDEATSALDDKTESQIIEELNNSARDKTIIMIAHRISSLKNCDRIYKLNSGIITNIYDNIQEIE
ncbi:MAG: ABC transporter ATP-binding protein [Burkholderiales bacterium]|nr:ABC transporter ATP-binding protein [Burkholderiales bacterium]